MGSFNATCIVSNLPIEAGDKVRYLALARNAFEPDGNGHVCYVGGRWQVYGVPIKAAYNDYGSVEKIEESFTTEMFFEGLRQTAVEKGVGDNSCHDVPIRAEMGQEEWLNALWEGRVEVLDSRRISKGEFDPSKYEPEEGIPSVRRLEKALKDAGFETSTDRSGGFMVGEVTSGFVRIRVGEYCADVSKLNPLLPVIDAAGYAAMITVGTGSYSDAAEILVAPKPSTDPKRRGHSEGLAPKERHYYKPRPVSLAMIREDVWQILLSIPVCNWSQKYTVEDFRRMALDSVEKEIQDARTDMNADELEEKWLRRQEHKKNFFLDCLGGHEGVSGLTFRAAYDLALSNYKAVEDLKEYVGNLAETVYVQWVYGSLHGQWHPTTNSGQEGHWKEHRDFLQKLLTIKGRWEEELEGDEDGAEDPV